MARKTRQVIDYQRVELDGTAYVILRESVFDYLCRQAHVERAAPASDESLAAGLELDQTGLAQKLARRRHSAGLTQAELARRAGIRPETLNRIERGRTTPDFATIRKLAEAINTAEQERAAGSLSPPKDKESDSAE